MPKRPSTAKASQRVRFESKLKENVEKRPSTAPPLGRPPQRQLWDGERGSVAPAFLRPDLSIKQKTSPVELYHRVYLLFLFYVSKSRRKGYF